MRDRFKLVEFEPRGDQPQAIKELVAGIRDAERDQVLLGVTGSGKTFTMAQVIEATQRPALILAPNKTLAAQLYGEFRSFFPDNAVEYFVSYYDYYQPEAYVPRTDTYIEKESSINEQIDRMRHSATRALLERDDVIIVASVSCIYGIGSWRPTPAMTFQLTKGERIAQRQLLADLVALQYKRNDQAFQRGASGCAATSSRCSRPTWTTAPGGSRCSATRWRRSSSSTRSPATSPASSKASRSTPTRTTSRPSRPLDQAIKRSRPSSTSASRSSTPPEAAGGPAAGAAHPVRPRDADGHRLCAGIENYSRYLTGRAPGEPPPTLFEYLPDNASCSSTRATSPCRRSAACSAATSTARRRWSSSASACRRRIDNRPLRFEEWERDAPQTVHVSATPGAWELERTGGVFAEQVIRPTGLIDPPVEIRPAATQVDDLSPRSGRRGQGLPVLVTVLTKRMAEDLTEYCTNRACACATCTPTSTRWSASRSSATCGWARSTCWSASTCCARGWTCPRCSLVAILDADKEGFLRSETSLIQTIGRAARNVEGKVLMYADRSPARCSAPSTRPSAAARSRRPTTPSTASRRRA
jgi:excinuclease ABC subunit B